MRLILAIVGVIAFTAIATMATAARATTGTAVARPSPTLAILERPDWPPAAPTDPPLAPHPRVLSGFVIPLRGVDLPQGEQFLPNSPRDYRAGYHEGIDFPIPLGTPVLAAKAGTVVRVDSRFQDWSAADERTALDEAQVLGYTPAATLDRIRGRQVWIDHGRGIVTRYAHLSGVAPLSVFDHVEAGDVVGAVGSSGYPEGGPHLHFEIRVGDDFYGDGLALPALRFALRVAFR
ncbi:MAG TPA: M23 family metallopeptidase [Candidatus Limnocylindria bacterium]|nr:M23 family metallopeptidase [Candidatus Limnocylindria bacterium]